MIYDQAHKLAQKIKNSPEYQELKEAKKMIDQNSESQKILADFHAKQLEIQAMQMMGQEISVDKVKEYEKMSGLLVLHPTVRDYLQAEFKLLKIMADIQKILSDALEIIQPKAVDKE